MIGTTWNFNFFFSRIMIYGVSWMYISLLWFIFLQTPIININYYIKLNTKNKIISLSLCTWCTRNKGLNTSNYFSQGPPCYIQGLGWSANVSFEFSIWKKIDHIWLSGLCNNHPVDFGFKSVFVLNIGDMAPVFGFKDVWLEFELLFKGLHIVRVVSNVEE